jgi:hypothetical protein
MGAVPERRRNDAFPDHRHTTAGLCSRHRRIRPWLIALVAAAVSAGTVPASALATPAQATPALAAPTAAGPGAAVPRLDHVFLIMEENNGFHDVIGDPAAPNSASVLLDGVTAAGGQVWAVGESDSPNGGFPLIEHDQDGRWTKARLPASAGSNWTSL